MATAPARSMGAITARSPCASRRARRVPRPPGGERVGDGRGGTLRGGKGLQRVLGPLQLHERGGRIPGGVATGAQPPGDGELDVRFLEAPLAEELRAGQQVVLAGGERTEGEAQDGEERSDPHRGATWRFLAHPRGSCPDRAASCARRSRAPVRRPRGYPHWRSS